MNKQLAARVACLDAYDRWKAATSYYERVLEVIRDERSMSEAVATGHHLNLCVLAAVASSRVEIACKRLAIRLDLQDWFENGAPSAKHGQPPPFIRRAPC